MKKNYLTYMVCSVLMCQSTYAEIHNPFSKPMNVWGTQIAGFGMEIQRKYIPEYTRNRYGEKEIIGISRVDVRLVNTTDTYRCGRVTIKDNERPNLTFNQYTKTNILLEPHERKTIGYFEPEDTENIDINYNLKRIDTVLERGSYTCQTESSPSHSETKTEAEVLEDCYITTAMCRDTGKADDCDELQTLRKYRDEVMLKNEIGRALVKEYYLTAPQIVNTINQQPNHKSIYTSLREQYIVPAANAARLGQNEQALRIYQTMVETLRTQYL